VTDADVEHLLQRLRAPGAEPDAAAAIDEAINACRLLHTRARSTAAIPLAQAALACSERREDALRTRNCMMVCGVLCADTGDVVAGIGYHLRALRRAAGDEDRLNMARCWNNLGTALGIAGSFALAARCYERCIALVEPLQGPHYSRYSGYGNLSDACYQLRRHSEGVRHGERALLELTPEFLEQDPYAAILLRRNLVRSHLAAGGLEQAATHMAEALEIADRWPTPRARIAADIIRASYELAIGRADVAITRLDDTLSRARELPATLRDTLACVVRAEESAGSAARALMRLEELSDHIYSLGIERAHGHLELAGLREAASSPVDPAAEHDRARLESKLGPREPPEAWKALQSLSMGAVMRFDETAWHGKRVGALTKALALAHGVAPLQALEMGLAAEVHDIGMLSVPEGILGKRGELNDSERALVRRHVEAGAEMLRDDAHPMVFTAREIARYHHTRWDGSGYPERVAGTFIPLAARICSIADAYDSMVCGIGHTARRDMAGALAELNREAGSQFDPGLVSCFDSLIRSESEDLGMDLETGSGMGDFQELVTALREHRGFV
jgi:putative two-component system response regulator